MKFQNANQAEVNFTICGVAYSVPAGGEVDVAKEHVKYMLKRGVQLTRSYPKPVPIAKPTKSKPAPPLKKATDAATGGESKDSTLPRVP